MRSIYEFRYLNQRSVAHAALFSGEVPQQQTNINRARNQVTPCSLEMKKLSHELQQLEKIYNTVRPHQSLGYLTPPQFLLRGSSPRKE